MRKQMLCAVVLACLATLGAAQGALAQRAGGAREFVVVWKNGATVAEARDAVQSAGGTVVEANLAARTATVRTSDPAFAAKANNHAALVGAVPDTVIGHAPSRGRGDKPYSRDVETERGEGRGHGRRGRDEGGDPLSSLQWDMRMIGATPAGSYRVQQARRAVRVGVLDTGVDGSHPDVAPNFDRALSRNFTTDRPSIDGPCERPSCVDANDEDESGHGTHVATTIAGALNGIGIAGVAPKADIVNLRVGQDSGFFFFQETVNALTYAGDNGVDVVNMSYFVDPWLYNCVANAFDTPEQQQQQITIRTAVQNALDYARAHGVTLIASAGNENTDLGRPTIDHVSPDIILPGFIPQPPGFDPNRPVDNGCVVLPTEGAGVLSVSAVGPTKRKAYYSNYGLEQTTVSAPGGDRREFFGTPQYNAPESRILAAYPLGVARAQCEVDDNGVPTGFTGCDPAARTERFPALVRDCRGSRCGLYQWIQGTSMAAPHATGVAALIVAEHGARDRAKGGLTLDPARTEQILRATATDTPCPEPRLLHYPDPGLDASFDALCEGTPQLNGFYGDGIVNALAAVRGAQGRAAGRT
ncbi:MAG TPA: S8 family serine peptidase [Solirubrobacteraceae bacterium]|nr:S8 family serine peptidase [Solirubrobacteraceae bacterium]